MVLRTCLISLAASTALYGSIPHVFAADLPVETYNEPYSPVYAAPPANWTGPYLGAMFGYNWGTYNPDSGSDIDADGFLIGGFGGYNFQSGTLVFGGEADLAMTTMEGDNSSADMDWTGSLRGRVGYTIDRHLAYGTAGLAFANSDLANDENIHFGLTAGAGLESMLNRNTSARFEYLYTNFSEENYSGSDVDLGTHTLRAGVGYHF